MSIPRTIIFIGPQGSGKGTQAKLLAEKINAIYVGTGSMFRKYAKQDDEFGRYISDLINNGLLASDADVERILHEKLDGADEHQVVIFDGVPRRLTQAEFLIKYMHAAGKKDIATFYITLPREEAIRRMSMRRVCVSCNNAISLGEGMTEEECKKCGGELERRADDQPDAINKRLDIYDRDTIPVLEFLKEHSVVHQLDGTKPIEEVQKEIDQILKAE